MSQESIDRFYEIAIANKALMRDIVIRVPARPHDGISIDLACKLSAWFNADIQWKPLEDSMAGFVEVTRMKIVWDFLHNHTEKFLLMIDNDTEPDIELPWLLARHGQPVVGSCIVSISPKGRPMLCFSRADRAGINRFIDFEDGDKIPAIGLAEVPHCGTGAMMIRRDVLESFSMEKGPTGIWDVPFMLTDETRVLGMKTGKLLEGEDIRFCKQARAKGYKIHVDMEAHCGHRKTMRMNFPPSQRDPSLAADEWFAPAKGMALSHE
jgi:hypothetical protein